MRVSTAPRASLRVKRGNRNRVPQPYDRRINATVIGRLVDLTDGHIIVELSIDGARERKSARSTVPIDVVDIDQEVVLIFAEGDVQQPIIIGVLQPHLLDPTALTAKVDDEKLVLSAAREIVLECGARSSGIPSNRRHHSQSAHKHCRLNDSTYVS